MDQMKESHDKRKAAIRAEKEARMKRLKDIPGELKISIETLSEVHNFLSILDMEKHHGKNMGDNNLSSAITSISKALTLISAYERGYKHEEK